MSVRRRQHILLAPIAGVLLLLGGAAALAEEPANIPSKAPLSPANAADASLWQFGEQNKFCLEWTDACRVCRRTGAGAGDDAVACSNIGIACQPQAIHCSAGR